jgi:hypothetical protein
MYSQALTSTKPGYVTGCLRQSDKQPTIGCLIERVKRSSIPFSLQNYQQLKLRWNYFFYMFFYLLENFITSDWSRFGFKYYIICGGAIFAARMIVNRFNTNSIMACLESLNKILLLILRNIFHYFSYWKIRMFRNYLSTNC